MNEIIVADDILIENMIYVIRGKHVMLDCDLAKLYKCTNGTKDINKAVKRNIERFPDDFYFQLTEEEFKDLSLRFQSGTLNNVGNLRGKHIKYLPYAFTEQGVAMLASVLRSDIAVETSIKIMRNFVKMRRYFANNSEILLNHENRLLTIENVLDKFKEKSINRIFFEKELYDAHSIFLDILNQSKNEIIIIDNFTGKELLDIIKNIDRKIVIVSKNSNEILKEKYKSQYSNVIFIDNKSFHDRFIIIDRKILYSCEASFKDLGKKCFGIHKIDDSDYITRILNIIDIKNDLK